jgi:(1->4)-alpha-D-glucan 1-alpha-D-glucosylmutase
VSRLGTYRIQLRPEFGFAQASELANYFGELGVSHVYCSPYLQATQGSAHGYDVVDHSRVNEELGGAAGRERFCQALAAQGLRQLLDIVPNHMAIRSGLNAWWWDVLENGPSSQFSQHFDVEWRSSEFERVLLPVLGDQYGVELEAGRILLERRGGRFLVRYFEHENPVAPRALGQFLRPVARRLGHATLAFVADCLVELPAPNATDGKSRRRRHRDKEVLRGMLDGLCGDASVAEAIDAVSPAVLTASHP